MTNENPFYLERRDDGTYAGTRGGRQRASAVGKTQSEVVEKLKKMDPDAPIHIERVRRASGGNPDKWRS